MNEIDALHTAARRYCIERSDELKAHYAKIARRNERPAKSGLLRKLGLTVAGKSREGETIWPRYKILDAILTEIERSTGSSRYTSREALEQSLSDAAQAAYDEEARPPDMVFNFGDIKSIGQMTAHIEAVKALGPRAKVVSSGGSERAKEERLEVMRDECSAFNQFLSSRTDDDLAGVEALPHRRVLREDEAAALRSLLNNRWGVDGNWYPLDRARRRTPCGRGRISGRAVLRQAGCRLAARIATRTGRPPRVRTAGVRRLA